MALNMRTKYTIIFMLFVILMGLLFLVNPWNIITDYSGPVMFFTLFVGILFVVMIYIYQNVLSDPKNIHETSNTSILTIIGKAFYILFALGASFGLIYAALHLMGIFDQDFSNPESWGYAIFNVVLFCAMLGMIYKLANAGGFLDKNPYYRLILNILFYIPCLLVILVDKIYQLFGLKKSSTGLDTTSAFSPQTQFEINMLIISVALLTLYFLWFFIIKKIYQNVYFKRGGKQLINQPLQTDILTNVISYQSLTNSKTFDYQYAMSFWVYLDSFPPSTNSSYSKLISLLSYGQNPSVKYC